MHWWNTKHLAKEIKDSLLSENDKMKYFLALSLVTTVAIYLVYLEKRESYLAIAIEMLLTILITITGIKITFKTNNGNKGTDYISRMTCLSFPILIKLFVYGLIFYFVSSVAAAFVNVNLEKNEWLNVAFSVSIEILYFWRLNIHLKYINA